MVSGEHRLTITLFRRNLNELQHVRFETVRIVAMAPFLDLALLKIEDELPEGLPVLPLETAGLSDKARPFCSGFTTRP